MAGRGTYRPEALKHIQVDIVVGELMVDGHVGLRLGEEGGIRHGGGCEAPSTSVRGEA